jgi:predicted outer membrane repeat protein
MYGLRIQGSSGAPAVEVLGSSVHMENCSFVDNNVSAVVVGRHGKRPGKHVHATIRSCAFEQNSHSGNGGAIRAYWRVVVDNSSFVNNRAINGGAMFVGSNALVRVHGTLFDSNVAEVQGGAIFIDRAARISLGKQTMLLRNQAPEGRSVFSSGMATATYVLYDGCGSNAMSPMRR